MGQKPIIKKSESPTMGSRAGLLIRCLLVLVASACGTLPSKGSAETVEPPAKTSKQKKARASKAKSTNSVSAPAAVPASSSKPLEAKKPVETKKAAGPAEPDLPTRFATPVFCPLPSEVPPNEELSIRCALKPSLGAHTVVVFYRVSGKTDYSTVDAIRSPRGWYVAKINREQVRGGSLQVYVQAFSPGNRVAGSNGSDDNPNVIVIRDAGSSGPGADEDPLARIQRENEAEKMKMVEGHRRPSPSVWLGMGIGSGMGWFPNRRVEPSSREDLATGWANGGLFHILPEIGYNWTPHIAFSLQGRYQFVKTVTEGGTNYPTPHKSALAVLGCAYLMTDSRTSDWQLFGTAAVGAGSAFRLYVAPRRAAGNEDVPNSGTVNGGPLVAGLGGGVAYHFTNFFALTGQVRSLLGIPKTAIMIEGGIGVQLAIWPFSAYKSNKVAPPPEELEPEPEYAPSEPVE